MDAASVRSNHLFYQSKADTSALKAIAGMQPLKQPEYTFCIYLLETYAIVRYAYFIVSTASSQLLVFLNLLRGKPTPGYLDKWRTIRPRKFERIVDEIVKKLMQKVGNGLQSRQLTNLNGSLLFHGDMFNEVCHFLNSGVTSDALPEHNRELL